MLQRYPFQISRSAAAGSVISNDGMYVAAITLDFDRSGKKRGSKRAFFSFAMRILPFAFSTKLYCLPRQCCTIVRSSEGRMAVVTGIEKPDCSRSSSATEVPSRLTWTRSRLSDTRSTAMSARSFGVPQCCLLLATPSYVEVKARVIDEYSL